MLAIFFRGRIFFLFTAAAPFFFLPPPHFSLTLKTHERAYFSRPPWTPSFFSITMDAPFFPDDCPASIKKERQPELYGPPPLLGVLCKRTLRVSQLIIKEFPKKDFGTGKYSTRPRIVFYFPVAQGDFQLRFDF